MKKVLLDTNFIVSCVKQKIDFFEYFELEGFQILVPEQVLNELKMLENRKKDLLSIHAKVALKLLEQKKFQKIDLIDDKVDRAIIKFAKKNPNVVIATLDREIRYKLKNKTVTIRQGKRLEIL